MPYSFMRASESFSIIFENAMIEWVVLIDKEFSFRRPRLPEQNFQITLKESIRRERNPMFMNLEYTIKLWNYDRSECSESLKYTISGMNHTNLRPNSHQSFQTEQNSIFGRRLTEILRESDKHRGKIFELTIRLDYKKSEFLSRDFLNLDCAPSVPVELDYTFDSLVNQKRFDYKLKNRSGQCMMANREILAMSSSFFRNLLGPTSEEMLTEVESIEAVQTVITYMITGRYKPPTKMTPNLAKEMIMLATTFKVIEFQLFKRTVERHCYDEIQMNSDDLIFVCNMLIVAQDANLGSVMSSCIATILYFHSNQFFELFVTGNHALKARLNEVRQFRGPSLVNIVKKVFASQMGSRRFSQKEPILVED